MKMEEQSHVWMNRCNEQKMQIEELKRKLEAKERQCTDFAQERAALEEQRDTLASKYQKLKTHVMQLQNLNNNFAAEEGFVGEPLMASRPAPMKLSPRQDYSAPSAQPPSSRFACRHFPDSAPIIGNYQINGHITLVIIAATTRLSPAWLWCTMDSSPDPPLLSWQLLQPSPDSTRFHRPREGHFPGQ